MNELSILTGCRQHEASSQRAFFEGFSPGVMAAIMRYVGDHDAAQDILQETFIKAFDTIGNFEWKGNGSLRAWITRIAVNMSLNHLRKNKKVVPDSEAIDAMADVADEPTADEVETIDEATIMGIIAQLPDGYRTVFNLYCIEGLSHKEIAQRLGINEKSSSSQLARAKAILAKRVKEVIKERENR